MSDDYWTLRIPKARGWRTLSVNALAAMLGVVLCTTSHAEAGGALCALALVNIVLRLMTATRPARSADVLGAIWTPKREPVPVVATLAAVSDSLRPVPVDAPSVLITELAEMLDELDRVTRAQGVVQVKRPVSGYSGSQIALTGCAAFCVSCGLTLSVLVLS